jgi:putative acyl-CoA dehydrogenase
VARGPEVVDAFFAELDEARGGDARLDRFVADLRRELGDFTAIESRARRLVERLALALQGALLVRHGDRAVADAFCAARLTGDHGLAFGTLPPGVDVARIVERARPHA